MPTALATPWPSGPGGRLDAGRVAVLRVARGLAAPGTQGLEVLQLEAPAAEVQLDVERHARVAAREHEPVAARPVRVGRVVAHHLLEEQVRRGGQAHGRAGVAVADLLHGVHRQHADGVDRQVVGLVPVQLRHVLPLAVCLQSAQRLPRSRAVAAGLRVPARAFLSLLMPRSRLDPAATSQYVARHVTSDTHPEEPRDPRRADGRLLRRPLDGRIASGGRARDAGATSWRRTSASPSPGSSSCCC